MPHQAQELVSVAERLCALYAESFAGKKSGRYRISAKLVQGLAKRKRLYESDVTLLARMMFERGFVLIDMGSFFVVLSANTFVNYRRVNDDVVS